MEISQLPLNALRAFEASARLSSFTRAGLTAVLNTCGFKVVEYGVLEDQRSAMEIIAVKA